MDAEGTPGRIARPPLVLVAGAASRDLTPDDPRGWRLGGAVLYASLALARLGLEARAVIGVDSLAARAAELDELRAAGVTARLANLSSGPVFDNVAHVLHAPSAPIPLTEVPRAWRSGFDALLLAPVAGEIGDAWAALGTGDPGPLVVLGWQGLLRRLVPGEAIRPRQPEASPVVRAARLAVVSREDVAPGTRPEALLELLAPGATLAWTEGVTGGLVLRADADAEPAIAVRYPAIPSDREMDPTGAGDVFLAALLACQLVPAMADDGDGAGFAAALRFAAAAASLAVEAPGIGGVADLERVRRRAALARSRASRLDNEDSSRGSGRPNQA